MSTIATISRVGLVFMALAQVSSGAAPPSTVEVGSTKVTVSHPEIASESVSALPELRVGQTWGADTQGKLWIDTDKDVLINGNWLLAGKYRVELYRPAEDDVQIAFREIEADGQAGAELLRLAAKPEIEPSPVESVQFGVEKIELPSEEENDADAEEEDGEDSDRGVAVLYVQTGNRKATLQLTATGRLWRATPPPPMPAGAQPPWAVVLDSLNELVAGDADKYVADFSEDFETNVDDGGSKQAHLQLINNMSRGGALEGLQLDLKGVEWELEPGQAVFKNVIVQSFVGPMQRAFTLELRDGRWQITFLSDE